MSEPIKLHDLAPVPGSNRRKKRVGRGIAGKGGKTAGRGTKGQKARSKVPARFEGGQMPLHMRIPKLKGFTNPFRVERSEEHTSELQSLMRISYAVFCLKKKKKTNITK